VFERLRRRAGGLEGGPLGPPGGAGGGAPRWGFGGSPRNFFFGPTYFRDHVILGGFSAHGFLPMVFYFRLRN
jgi:hypothetical protein